MVPASSMHGRSLQAQVAGATGACLHAWAVRESVSAQCTPTPRRRCTAWQGMGCERDARATHERATRWRKHSSTSACSPGGAPAPRPASHPMGWVLGLCTSAPQATGCRLGAHRLQQATMIKCAGRLLSAQGPSASSNGALLSLTIRKKGQPH